MGMISLIVLLPLMISVGALYLPYYILIKPMIDFFDEIRPVFEFIISHH